MKQRSALLFLTALFFTVALVRADDGPVEQVKSYLAKPRADRGDLDKQPFATAKLTKDQVEQIQGLLWADHVAYIKATRQKEWDNQAIAADGQTLKLLEKSFGTKPKDGWNLYISMHGGGGAPKALNDSQWKNQIRLYQPEDSLYIAPRAPTNDWDLWHKKEIDDLFDRLIEDAIVLGEVNPNRVYIMGYSAGGDGVYQLAPRMADRWAAASMMAGHPGDASVESLRNIGFIGQVGALDGGAQGYHRNEKLTEFEGKMDAIQKTDPAGYAHEFHLREGKPHWMDMEDAKPALDFMAKFTRNPLPDKIVWRQNGVTHDRFYWLAVPPGEAKNKQLVIASRKDQTITIEKAEDVKTLIVRLNDKMLDLDKPVTITMDGKTLFSGVVPRTAEVLHRTLDERGDPDAVFSAAVTVKVGG
jgi:hypothetical protein